jgi:hypothetical protein
LIMPLGTLGNPNIPSLEGYPGWMGFKNALNAYFNQVTGEGSNAAEQAGGAAAADPMAANYQANTGGFGGIGGGGRGQEAATRAYSGIMGPSDVAGVASGDTARTNALQNIGSTELGAANNVYSQQMAKNKANQAQTQQSTNELGLIGSIPSMLGPQGGLGQLTQAFGGGPGSSPLGFLGQGGQGIFSSLMGLFGGGGGADALGLGLGSFGGGTDAAAALAPLLFLG